MRLVDQAVQLAARPVGAVQCGERRLAGGGVLVRRLAHLLGVGRQVEQVVGELEGKADRRAEFGQPLPVVGWRAGDDDPGIGPCGALGESDTDTRWRAIARSG